MAEREGVEPVAFILPKILANFCCYCQCYKSLATVARTHFTSILGKSNRRHFGSNGSQDWANLRILGCTTKIIFYGIRANEENVGPSRVRAKRERKDEKINGFRFGSKRSSTPMGCHLSQIGGLLWQAVPVFVKSHDHNPLLHYSPPTGSKRPLRPLLTSSLTRFCGSFTTNWPFDETIATIFPFTLSPPELK